MKMFKRKSSSISLKSTVFMSGALFVYVVSFNTSYADSHCKLVCKPMKNALEECLWEPKGCNNASKLGIPKSQLDQLMNPQLVNPQLINPKRQFVPGDQFKPKRQFVPGDQFKPNKL